MKIHIRQMEHGRIELDGCDDPGAYGLAEGGVEAVGDLHYELHAGLSDGGLWVHGTLELPVRMVCVRCLEPFTTTLRIPDFAHQIELEGKESVDLTPLIREDILLALPPYPKCDEEEGRTCPFGSGAAESTGGNALPEETVVSRPPAWEALERWKPSGSN